MPTYSLDLRQRVLADCDAGLKTKAVAEKYGVSRTWVRSLKQRRRETGPPSRRSVRPGASSNSGSIPRGSSSSTKRGRPRT